MTICAERPNADRVALAGELRKLLADALVRDFRQRLQAARAKDGDHAEGDADRVAAEASR